MLCLELSVPPLPQFITVGNSVWKPGMVHPLRSFSVYDVLFIKSGTIYITEDRQEYTLTSGDILVLEPGKKHWGHRMTEESSEIYWVHLKHDKPIKERDSSEIPWSSVITQGQDEDQEPIKHALYIPKYIQTDLSSLLPILDKMVTLHSRFIQDYSLQLHLEVGNLLHWLWQSVRALSKTPSFHLSEQAIRYLQEHMVESFHSEDMEQSLNYKFDHIIRCLKAHTGITPLQYLNHIRLEKAKTLLRTTDMPIKDICFQIGIHDYNYFNRLFRLKIGISPGKYRRN